MARAVSKLGRRTNERTPGLLGRLPAERPLGLYELPWYVAGSLPTPPSEVKVPGVKDWGMLGNNSYGDCAVAGLEHAFMADAAVTGVKEIPPSASDCVEYYLTYTGNRDSGCVLSQLLAYVRTNGFYGMGVQAFAPVSLSDLTTLRQSIWLFDNAYLGIIVTDSMQRAFQANEPWTTSSIPGNIVGGHCITAVGYDEHFLYVVTWGQIQAISWLGWHMIGDEAWAIITSEIVAKHGNGRGVDLEALQSDLDLMNKRLA